MDTRSKIVPLETAAARASGTNCTVLLSSFDVLTAARIRRVRQIAKNTGLLVVVISESADSLLPVQARAELAASLAMVDLVVISDASLAKLPGALIINDREEDQRQTAELIAYVHERNRGLGE